MKNSARLYKALKMYSFHINVKCKCCAENLLNCEKNIIIIKIAMISKSKACFYPRKVEHKRQGQGSQKENYQ